MKLAQNAIPPGGDVTDGAMFLSDRKRLAAGAKDAAAWCEAAITAVRAAADPNPWATASDEEIAGEILRRLEERK